MAWRAITEADVTTRLSGPELEGFRGAALAEGQEDPVASIISQVTANVRGYVAGCQRNRLGAAGTIPESLLGEAIDLILIEIQNRAAGMLIDPEDVRKRKMERAERKLRDVAACAFAIEQPETATTETFGGVTPLSTRPVREFDNASQDGI